MSRGQRLLQRRQEQNDKNINFLVYLVSYCLFNQTDLNGDSKASDDPPNTVGLISP